MQNNCQYPAGTQMSQVTMYHPMIMQASVHSQPSPVFNQPQYHQFPNMDEPASPLSSLGIFCPTSNAQTNNAAATTSSDETLSHVSSVEFPPMQNAILGTPQMFPYHSQGVTMSPLGGGLCSPGIVSVENLQTAWVTPGTNLAYVPQPTRMYSPAPQPAYVPFAQPFLAPTPPPPAHFDQYQNEFQPQLPPQLQPQQQQQQQQKPQLSSRSPPRSTNNNHTERSPHFSLPQSKRIPEQSQTRLNRRFKKKECFKTFPEENDKRTITSRHHNKKNGGCVPVSKGRKNYRIRCKACSAPVSRQVVKDVKPEDLASAFADQNDILDQLPEFFGEPLLNFPEIVFYMQIFSAKSKDNDQLQYFKVPRPAKERELHIDHRLTELFIRNFGFDHACEHHEFKRQPTHVPGICHARNLYRQLIVDSLLPTFLAYVRNMDEAKRLFGIIFRYVGCATPKDIATNIPQVWTAVTNVDEETSLEITGIVSLYNYHLFRRLIVKN
jgi:transcription elongation factor Elf1